MADPVAELPETLVDREEVAVMFARVPDFPDGVARGWAELEAKLGSLRGRRFYGSVGADAGEYRVCAELRPDDDADALGLETGALPGGRYARVRLRGEPPAVYALIGHAFEQLDRRGDHDPTRPKIEFYRSRDVVDVLLPVTA